MAKILTCPQELFNANYPFSASDGEKVAKPDEVNREIHESREIS